MVFVIDGGVAKLRPVETGLASENEIEIVSGLAEGEKVVEGPYRVLSRELADGKPVTEEAPGGKGGRGRPEGLMTVTAPDPLILVEDLTATTCSAARPSARSTASPSPSSAASWSPSSASRARASPRS